MIPRELLPEPGDIERNAGLPRTNLTVTNTGDRSIQVGMLSESGCRGFLVTLRSRPPAPPATP